MMLQHKKWLVLPIACIALFVLCGSVSHAQVLTPDIPGSRHLALAEEQFLGGHFATAAQSARQYLAMPGEKATSENLSDIDKAKYLLVVSCLKTDMPGSGDSAEKQLAITPSNVYAQRISFALAQYYFQHNELVKAIPLYESANISNLSNTEIIDAKFELAYCYFNNHQFDKAEPLFLAIKEIKDGKYYMAGNYYYGLLSYSQNKYADALKSFERIRNAKDYKGIVPYYIAEVYYFMGNRAKALHEADTLLKSGIATFYDNELHLLAAQCLFEDQRYREAKPYFEFYYDHTDKIRKEDLYKMAYCFYRIDDWQNAVDKFKLLSNAHDSLGQTAMYLLGDCYLKTGDKQSARNAFGICADMAYNTSQQEAAMILYAKLSYDMGYNDEALRELNLLLTTFASTRYRDEANTLISDLLIKTNNYSEALKHLEAVQVKDKEYDLVYQKAAYGYAIQQYRRGELVSAEKYLASSLQHPVNGVYENAACFWRGELAYHMHHYADVITYSQRFVARHDNKSAIEKLSPLATLQHAYLNMGYAAMETQNYTSAQTYFNQAQLAQGQDIFSESVAAVREADAVFMQKNYSRAISLYEKIINSDSANADYAIYQKGILLGLQGKNTEKLNLLKSLLYGRNVSAYANFARYEIAITYIESDRYPLALPYLQQLTDSAADKSFAPRAWMKTGFIYQQTNDHAKAIDAYKHVVKDYPAADEERISALESLKSLYIQGNEPGEYTKLLRENHLPSADSGSIDSTYYAAAETQFSNGKWESARFGFTNYLQQYPNGIFAIKARYYRAESNYQLRKYKDAREDYNMVLETPWSDFSENSVRRAAGIAYEEKDYGSAYIYFGKLREHAQMSQSGMVIYDGLMKSGFHAGKYSETVLYADSLLAIAGVSAETANDAQYYKARALQQLDKKDEAAALYQQLAGNKNGEVAAESRFHIAEMLYQQDKLKEAETAADEAIKLTSGYDNWNIKSFMLMADILVKQKDYFNAKALLQSIVKRTKVAEVKLEANRKLDEVKKLEKSKSKLSEE